MITRKISIVLLILIIIFSCEDKNTNPKYENIEFIVLPIQSSSPIYNNSYLAIHVERLGTYEFTNYVVVNLYISKDETYSSDDQLLNTADVSFYGTNEGYSNPSYGQVNFFLDTTIKAGDHYIIANFVPKVGTSTPRYSSAKITVLERQPALNYTTLEFSKSNSYTDTSKPIYEGSIIFQTVSYTNNELSDKIRVAIKYYFSADQTLDTLNDINLGSNNFDPDQSSSSYTSNIWFKLPNVDVSGTYYLFATGTYNINGKVMTIPPISKPIAITNILDYLKITKVRTDTSSYKRNQSISIIITLSNTNSYSFNTGFICYLSKDLQINYAHNRIISNEDYDISPGKSTVTITSKIETDNDLGDLNLIPMAVYSIYGYQRTATFAGPNISITP